MPQGNKDISVRLPPDLHRKILDAIETGPYETKAQVFRAALRFFFEKAEVSA